MLAMALFNWPIVSLLNTHLFHNGYLAWIYFFTIPLLGLSAYIWKRQFFDYKAKRKLVAMDLKDFVQKRNDLEAKIDSLVKV